MSRINIKKVKSSSRELFKLPFHKFQVKLTVLQNNYVFIGSSKDELTPISEKIFDENIDLDSKLRKIADSIEPMRSTILINGKPYIPGSTLKGMIRFFLEHSFKEDNSGKIYSCFIKQAYPENKENILNFLKKFGYYPNVPREREIENIKSDYFCKVCDLFGNSNLASRIIVSDAIPYENVAVERINLSEKWDDKRRVITPGSQFIFTVNVNNAEMEDLALLYLGMNLHNDGTLLLGMNKFSPQKDSKGMIIHFGKIKLKIVKIFKFSNDKNGFSEKVFSSDLELKEFKEDVLEEIKNLGDQLRNFNEIQEIK